MKQMYEIEGHYGIDGFGAEMVQRGAVELQKSEVSTNRSFVARAHGIGIPEAERKVIVEGLSRVLADSYSLYLKTHGFHWNVTGPMFYSLHLLFETQYTELAMAVDLIAERIRALGSFSPASFSELSELASIVDNRSVPDAEGMLDSLCDGHEVVMQTARRALVAAEKSKDVGTVDLLTQRILVHEKSAWMLRSLIST